MSTDGNCTLPSEAWRAMRKDPSATGAVGVASMLSALLLLLSASTVGHCLHRTCHKMAGHMLVGLISSDQILNLIHVEYAREYLSWLMHLCQAFVAFESATHLIHRKEALMFGRMLLVSSLTRWVACFAAGFGLFAGLASNPSLVMIMSDDGWQSTPPLGGGLIVAASIAVGMVCTCVEPSATMEFLQSERASGLHSAMSIRLSSSMMLLSTLAMLVLTPIIANMQYGLTHIASSTAVSIVLTLLVSLVLWRVALLLLYLPCKRWATFIFGNGALRMYNDEMDRAVKLCFVLAVSCLTFWLANFLDSRTVQVLRLPHTFPLVLPISSDTVEQHLP